MSRTITPAMLSAIAAGTVYPILFAWFDFTGGVVRVCTDARPVTWDGNVYSGLGQFGSITQVKETKAVQANGITFTLNKVDSTLMTEVLTLRSRGRGCKLWLGFYDTGGVLLVDPLLMFSGRMDQPKFQDGGSNSVVMINAESRMADLQRARISRYTDQDQRNRYPGDYGLSFVAGLQNKTVTWGQASTSNNSPTVANDRGKGFSGRNPRLDASLT